MSGFWTIRARRTIQGPHVPTRQAACVFGLLVLRLPETSPIVMSSAAEKTRAFAEQVVRRLRDAGHQALFAGGCVRDLLLEREPQDFDVATSALPDQVRQIFGHRRTLAVGASFGVIVVLPSKPERDAGVLPVEVATFRTEGRYLDGRRPESVAFADAEADAKRRDFTINGMFFDPLTDQVIDYVGGQEDLGERIVRAIGDPHARMREDKLRLLRAVRFAATFAFELEEQTRAAVQQMAGQLTVVSAERIAQELKRMLVHDHRRRAVELCHETGLLEVIFPELTQELRFHESDAHSSWSRTLAALQLLNEPRFESVLVVLLQSLVASSGPSSLGDLCRRLKLSNDKRELIVWLAEHRGDLESIPERPRWFLKRLCAHTAITELLTLERAIRAAENESLDDVDFVARYLATTPRDQIDPRPLLDGQDLISLGYRPGPEFKRLLDGVRNAQLDESIGSREEAIALVRRLHGEPAADTK